MCTAYALWQEKKNQDPYTSCSNVVHPTQRCQNQACMHAHSVHTTPGSIAGDNAACEAVFLVDHIHANTTTIQLFFIPPLLCTPTTTSLDLLWGWCIGGGCRSSPTSRCRWWCSCPPHWYPLYRRGVEVFATQAGIVACLKPCGCWCGWEGVVWHAQSVWLVVCSNTCVLHMVARVQYTRVFFDWVCTPSHVPCGGRMLGSGGGGVQVGGY